MIIALGNDHVAVEMKKNIKAHLQEKGYTVSDLGTNAEESADYPLYAKKVCELLSANKAHLGILICGTGIGMSIAANKIKGIRCAAVSEPYSARLSKEHNNTNVLAFGARVVGTELAKMIVDQWLEAEFSGGRHQTRVDMFE